MPVENLAVMALNDISQVQIACQCGACFTFDPDKDMRLPASCHQCQMRWREDCADTLDRQAVDGFMQMFREVRRQQSVNPRMKIKLVFQEDATGS